MEVSNIDVEPEIRPLKLAFLGYTSDLSQKGLWRFAEDNIEQVDKLKRRHMDSILLLKDGTIIIAISHGMNLRGHKFDQLILCDDERWEITYRKSDIIDLIISETMYISCVP